jgi:branched-chain amino acid transport system permease protein
MAKPVEAAQPQRASSTLLNRAGQEAAKPGAVGFALAIIAVVVAYYFVDFATLDLLVQGFIVAIFAISLDLLWGYAGILSLGQSAFFGVGAYAAGISITQIGETGPGYLVACLGGIIVAVLLALIVGWVTFYSRVSPLYVAVITLALALVFFRLASLTDPAVEQYTGGFNGLNFTLVDWSIETWYWACAAALGVVTVLAMILVRSDLGRVLIGIRENERRLLYLGYRVPHIKLLVFALSAALAAIAGMAFGSYLRFASPDLLGTEYVVLVLVVVSIGGRGTIVGPILGAIAIGLVGPKVSAESPEYWELVLGLLFLVTVTFFSRGLYPPIRDVAERAMQRVSARLGKAAGPERRSKLVVTSGRAAARPDGERAVLGEISDVHKSFGALQVLRGVDLEMRSGEILCIIGPNGAGKSTLINLITDGREVSSGTISLNGAGTVTTSKGPAAIAALGVGRTFQGANLMESYTPADSLLVAGGQGRMPSWWRRRHEVPVSEEVAALASATGLDEVLDVPARDLPHGLRQATELAMTLAANPNLILLDEPTAGLTQEERTKVGELLRHLASDQGRGIVLIEHDLDFVRGITDRVVVLHQGRVVADGTVEEVVTSPVVREIYLGETRDAGV